MANATLVSQKVQEINLSNKLEQAGQIQLDSSFSLNVSFANDGTRCVGKLTQTLRDKEFAGGKFTMSVELVGIFNCTGAVTDEVKRQVHGEVYDQLFPYMQSQCANLAAASGAKFQLTPITLPSIKRAARTTTGILTVAQNLRYYNGDFSVSRPLEWERNAV